MGSTTLIKVFSFSQILHFALSVVPQLGFRFTPSKFKN